MTTLQANRAAQKAHAKKQRAGAIPPPLTLEEITQETAEEITVIIEQAMSEADQLAKVRLRRAALAVRGNPMAYRKRERTFPTEPTPEMRARYGDRFVSEVVIPGSGPVPPLNRHRPKRILETFGKHFTEHERNALARFAEDAEAATIHNVTRNYAGSSGGGRPWEKLGGLGNASELKQLQYARFQFVWSNLPYQFHNAARWLVFEVGSDGMDTLPGMVEAAQHWVPTLKHKEVCRGISIGVLKGLSWCVMRLYQMERDQRMFASDKMRRDDAGREA